MMRILITGDRGFFGTRFHTLYDRVHSVLGIDKDDIDIVNREAVVAAFREFRPDVVIHAAAITSTAFSDANPDLTRAINVDGATNVAEATREVGAKMIFFSTEQVFNGNNEAGPYGETDEPRPNTMYGQTKLEAEASVRKIIDELWILRFTWLFGIPERAMPVNPNIVWNALQIAGRGVRTAVATNEFRGHTYGYDMIQNVMRVPEGVPYGTYHIGSTCDLGRYDLTKFVLTELGLGDRVDELILPDNEKYVVPRDVRLATSKLASYGIEFESTTNAISRSLSEFGLAGAFA